MPPPLGFSFRVFSAFRGSPDESDIARTAETAVATYIVQRFRMPVLFSQSAHRLGQFVTGNSDGLNP